MSGALTHFLEISQYDTKTLEDLLQSARRMKDARAGLARGVADQDRPLEGKILAMIFEKPSTRTRVSFDVGMRQLGGETIILSKGDTQLGRGETIADTARVLSRFVDAIMIRTDKTDKLHELAHYASVPVINGLTDDSHPCQIMADMQTLQEKKGPLSALKIAWLGDFNNVTNSFVHAASRFGFALDIAIPAQVKPTAEIVQWLKENGGKVEISHDPQHAVQGADCVVTDTWISMGDDETRNLHNQFMPFQVNEQLMAQAKPDAIFMHCLPAHRNEEVTDAVMDGPQSVVFDEAENRLHAQKAILKFCMGQ